MKVDLLLKEMHQRISAHAKNILSKNNYYFEVIQNIQQNVAICNSDYSNQSFYGNDYV